MTLDFGKTSVFSREQTRDAQNLAVSASAARPVMQAKLEIGAADDPLEREADHVAEHVLRAPDSSPHGHPTASERHSQGEAGYPAVSTTALTAPPIARDVLRSAGQPSDAASRGYFEPRFGYDFSQVRVQVDNRAAESSGSSGPQSLTVRRQPAKDQEYIPPVAAAERQPTDPKKNVPEVLGRLDLDDIFKQNPKAKERVETVANELELDPGLLTGSLYAETATEWMRTTGTIASEALGLDDWFGDTTTGCDADGLHCNPPDHDPAIVKRLQDILAAHPKLGLKYNDVKKTGAFWNTATEKTGGLWKPRGTLDADKSVAAWGVYIKMQENVLRASLAADPSLKTAAIRNLEDLTPEQRLTIERLAANAGVGVAKEMFKELAAGGDIPRTGGTRRDRFHAFRTAVLHMARAVHLDQTIFGRPSSDYRPPAKPISHDEAAELYDMPWLKKLPEWITPTHY